MSDACHPGMSYLLQLYTEEQERIDVALTHPVCYTETGDGLSGILMPYQMRSDWLVTSILFLCFILVSFVLSRDMKHLRQQLKNFISNKERASLFDDRTATDMRHTLILVFQACILLGFCVYKYFTNTDVLLFKVVPHYLLLGIYIGFILLFFIFKWVIYSFVNWIFFDKAKNIMWMESYFSIVITVGILLFPIILLIVYFDIISQFAPYFICSVIIIAKILLLYKCVNNFFNKIYGAFHLILYFYALEILPELILWRGISVANNVLILNFLVH